MAAVDACMPMRRGRRRGRRGRRRMNVDVFPKWLSKRFRTLQSAQIFVK